MLAASAMLPAQAREEPAPACAVDRSVVLVRRFADLPAAVREDVLRGGAVAEAGKPFTPYDMVVDPRLPHRRFVLAGSRDRKWFVWIDHGGFGRHYDVLGYYPVISSENPKGRLMLVADFSGEPCAAIEAFFHGVVSSGDQTWGIGDG